MTLGSCVTSKTDKAEMDARKLAYAESQKEVAALKVTFDAAVEARGHIDAKTDVRYVAATAVRLVAQTAYVLALMKSSVLRLLQLAKGLVHSGFKKWSITTRNGLELELIKMRAVGYCPSGFIVIKTTSQTLAEVDFSCYGYIHGIAWWP